MNTFKLVIVASLVTAVSFAACSKSDCEKLYDKTKKCSKEKVDIPKKAFMELCKAMADKESLKDEMTCVSKSSCDDYNKCVKEKGDARFAKKQIERMEKKLKEKKFSDIVSSCKYMAKDNKPLEAKCKELLPKACTGIVEKAKESKKGGKKDYGSCIYIKDCSKLTKDEKYTKDSEEACK